MSDTQDTLIERLNRGRLAYMSNSGPVYAGPTALEREAAAEIEALEEERRLSMGVIAFERSRAERAEAALADRDAKIAERTKERDLARAEKDFWRTADANSVARAKDLEAQVAELTQKLERMHRRTQLAEAFTQSVQSTLEMWRRVLKERETPRPDFYLFSFALADIARAKKRVEDKIARALNSGASQNG